MNGFQIFVTSLFVGFIVVGVGAFALFGGAFGGKSTGKVVVWGTEDEQTMSYLLESLRSTNGALQDTSYVKKDPATYQSQLLNAMAAGTGPDLFIVSQDQLGTFSDKVAVVPYGTLPQATYLSSYVDEGRLFLTSQGALALPFMIDPLVMYWNRDIFAAAGQSSPPQYWSDLLTAVPALTKLDGSSNVQQSAVAMGSWQNVTNAKAELSALFMQAGDFITAWSSANRLVPTFGSTPPNATETPAVSALRFYTEFSNPSKTAYTWNTALPNSADAFAGGQLAIYFGFASEYKPLLLRNPNLRFGVALLPQLKGASAQLTYGNLLGIAVSRTAPNLQGAYTVAQILTSPSASQILATQTGLPPARRDVSIDTSANAAASVFVQSALIARGWIDPNPQGTDDLFKTMIQSVTSGAATVQSAVSDAAAGFGILLPYHP